MLVQKLYEGSEFRLLFPTVATGPWGVMPMERGLNTFRIQPRASLQRMENSKTEIKRHILGKIH